MPVVHSKLTSQGQVSVPASVRRKLGVGPGAVLAWEEADDGSVVVRRSGRYTFEDMHRELFPDGPPTAESLEDLKEGIRHHMRDRYARR